MTTDHVGALGVRLQPQGASVVHPQFQRLIIGGAQEISTGIGTGVAGQRPESATPAGVVLPADPGRAVPFGDLSAVAGLWQAVARGDAELRPVQVQPRTRRVGGIVVHPVGEAGRHPAQPRPRRFECIERVGGRFQSHPTRERGVVGVAGALDGDLQVALLAGEGVGTEVQVGDGEVAVGDRDAVGGLGGTHLRTAGGGVPEAELKITSTVDRVIVLDQSALVGESGAEGLLGPQHPLRAGPLRLGRHPDDAAEHQHQRQAHRQFEPSTPYYVSYVVSHFGSSS